MSAGFTRKHGHCPYCSVGIGTHEFIELGSARIGVEGSLADNLTRAINEHDWSSALSIRESIGSDDAIVFWVFRCPITGAGFLAGEEWFGTYAPSVIRNELLSAEMIDEISDLAGSRWSTTEAAINRIHSKVLD
jgi:hypothetical protein